MRITPNLLKQKDLLPVTPEPEYDLEPQDPNAPIDPMLVPPEPNYEDALQGLDQATAPKAPVSAPEPSLFQRISDQLMNQQAAGNIPTGGIEDAPAPAPAPSIAKRLMNAAMPAAAASEDVPQDFAAPAAPESPDSDLFSDDVLTKAQSERDSLIKEKASVDNLDKLATAMGSLGSGRQLKQFGGTEHLDKLAATKTADIEARRKGAKDKLSYEEALREVKSEKEKSNPESMYSKTMRDFMRKVGVNVPEGTSGADLEKAAPYAVKIFEAENSAKLAQARMEESRANKASVQDRLKSKEINKRFSDMNNKITAEIASGRTVLGRAAASIRAAENMEAVTKGKDLNNLNPMLVKELVQGLNALLTQGGQPSITLFEHLVPKNILMDTAKLQEYIMSKPVGAKQGQFVKSVMDIVAREKAQAKSQIKNSQNKLLAGYSDLKEVDPDRYNKILKSQDLVPDTEPTKNQISTAEKWLEANPDHPDAAALRQHLDKMKR